MINNKASFNVWLQRILIIGFWLSVTAAFLYSPYLNKFFNRRKTLNVFTWADMLDADSIHEFERENGVKVNLSYYDNNEELRTKLKISKGRGYDVFILTDYSVESLVKLDILQPLDKSKLNFLKELEPRLQSKLTDLDKKYLLPLYWDIYGIGVNKKKFDGKSPGDSWGLVFDPDNGIKNIGMVDEALEATCMATQYLYGGLKELSKCELKDVKKVLTSQKKRIEAYTDLRSDFLLMSGSSPVAVSQGAYIFRAMRNSKDIEFIIPKEGSFLIFDGISVAKSTDKKDLVYKFINFMFRKHVVEKFVEEFEFLPLRKDVLDEIDLNHIGGKERFLNSSCLDKLEFFHYVAPKEKIGKLWIEVKAS